MGIKYTAEEFAELDLGDYRNRFPEETKGLTDRQIWNVVMPQEEDDLDDGEWRDLFIEEKKKNVIA